LVINVLRRSPHLLLYILCIIYGCISLWGNIRIMILSKKLKKHDNTEIISKKISDKIWVTNIIIFIVWITVLAIIIIVFLTYYNISKF
jgi:Mn2+/Fe2+ NRAMP family transporter